MTNKSTTKRPMDSGLICLMIMSRFYGTETDPGQIRHRFGQNDRPLNTSELLRALQELGFRARYSSLNWKKLVRMQLPAIMKLKDGRFALLVMINGDEVLLQTPGEKSTTTLSKNEFIKLWDGHLILANRAPEDSTDERFGFRWFLKAALRYRSMLGEVLVGSFFVQFFALISPLVFMLIIDKVLTHRSLDTLDVLVFALAVVSVFEVILSGLRTYLASHTSNRIDVELGARIFRHLLSLPLGYFQGRAVGDTVARLRELETVRNFLTGSALTLILDLFFTLVFLAVMFAFSPFLTLVVLGILPLFFIASMVMTPLLKGSLDDKYQRNAEAQSFLVETVGAIETVKGAAIESQTQRQWEEKLARYVNAAFSGGRLANITNQTISFLSKAMIVLLLWLGARLVMDGELTVGQLIAFNMLASRVNAPVLRLAQMWQELQQMRISVRRLGEILDTPVEPGFKPGRTAPPAIRGKVEIDRVSYRYQTDGTEVLDQISFLAEAGELVGVTGSSGSGKSTLMKLLQRLYIPTRGRVLIDGIDLAQMDGGWLRRQIGVVAQDGVLFNRTVRDNIALSDPAMTAEQVMEAAELAGAHEFILGLPDGYDTLIGERGDQLSGGQRQRIAIARALAANPRILILDEATSALDFESEQIIRRNLKRICKGRTVFLVTHRLSSLTEADRILTLENGCLVEDGDHATLLAMGGRYAQLHSIQEAAHAHA